MATVKELIQKNKNKKNVTIVREAEYKHKYEKLKFKFKTIFHTSRGKIIDIDLKYDSLLTFKLRNFIHHKDYLLSDRNSNEASIQYKEFENYIVRELYIDYGVKVYRDEAINRISLYKPRELECKYKTYLIGDEKRWVQST